MQHVAGQDNVVRTNLEALLGDVSFNVEPTVFDERVARESLARRFEESGGNVREVELGSFRRQQRQHG